MQKQVVSYLRLLKAEFKRGFVNYIRYPLKAAFEVAGVMIFFWAVSSGSVSSAVLQGAGSREAILQQLISFVLLFFALAGVQGANRVVREESDTGTLEQLCLSPFGLSKIVIARGLTDTLRMALPLSAAWIGISIVSHEHIVFSPYVFALAIPVALIMNIGMLGMGFVVGAMALVFKRVGFLANLVSLALLPLMLGAERLPGEVARLAVNIPLVRAGELLSNIASGPFYAVDEIVRGFRDLSLTSLVWIVVGIMIFHGSEHFARDRGLLGKY